MWLFETGDGQQDRRVVVSRMRSEQLSPPFKRPGLSMERCTVLILQPHFLHQLL